MNINPINSISCTSLFDNGIINSDVDEQGNFSNSNYTLNSKGNFNGKIQGDGKIILEVVQQYGLGGYSIISLNGTKI